VLRTELTNNKGDEHRVSPNAGTKYEMFECMKQLMLEVSPVPAGQ